jgi:hypothetical protein
VVAEENAGENISSGRDGGRCAGLAGGKGMSLEIGDMMERAGSGGRSLELTWGASRSPYTAYSLSYSDSAGYNSSSAGAEGAGSSWRGKLRTGSFIGVAWSGVGASGFVIDKLPILNGASTTDAESCSVSWPSSRIFAGLAIVRASSSLEVDLREGSDSAGTEISSGS